MDRVKTTHGKVTIYLASCDRDNEKTQPAQFSLCLASPEGATHRSTIPASFCNLGIALLMTLPLRALSYVGAKTGKGVTFCIEKCFKGTEHFA